MTDLEGRKSNPNNVGHDNAAINTYVIEYDFQTGDYVTNNIALRVHEPVIYKIRNINRMAYNVTVKSRDSILADSSWSHENLIEQIKDEAKTTSVLENNARIDAIIGSTESKSIISEDFQNLIMPNEMEAIRGELQRIAKTRELYDKVAMGKKSIEVNESKLAAYQKRSRELDSILKLSVVEETQMEMRLITANIQKVQEEIKDEKASVEKAKAEKEKLEGDDFERLQAFRKNLIEFRESFFSLRDHYNSLIQLQSLSNHLNEATRNPILTYNKFVKVRDKFSGVEAQLENFEQWLAKFNDAYLKLGFNYSDLINDDELFNIFNYGGRVKLLEPADRIKKAADMMEKEIVKLNVRSTIYKIKCQLILLNDPQTYEFISSPVQPTNDVAVFDVEIKSRHTDNEEMHNTRKFNHKEFTTGGVRLDFGVGLALQYLDDAPLYDVTVIDGQNVIAKVSSNNFYPSVVGMATMAFRSAGIYTFGISAGLGVNVADGKIQTNNFYFGPSFILGRYERFCLTLGGTVKGIKMLRSGYDVGDPISNNDISGYVTDTAQLGLFTALTINLTKGVKQNINYLKRK